MGTDSDGEDRLRIALGSDHAGESLKDKLPGHLREERHGVKDCGLHNADPAGAAEVVSLVAQALAAGEADLRLGRKLRRIRATEVGDAEKPPLLHAYLERWSRETSGHFKADASTPLEELAVIAPDHPVFVIDDA